MGKVYLSQFNFKNYLGADSILVKNEYQTPTYLEELSLDNSNNIYLSKKTGLRYDYLVTTEGEDQVYVNSNLVGFCRDLTELKETDFLNKDIVNYRLAYNMHTAFSNCYQLSGTPVSARNVRSMYGTYYNCQNLVGRAAVNANVNNLIGTYYNCNSITTVPHTTENARMMIDTFYNCTNLEGSPTDADLAVSMQNAYYNCYLLEGKPANCNSAIITVNAYYNCPNIYGNFYWCNRDFDQAEKIQAVNMFYNRDTSKRLNIFIRRDSAVENALINHSDTVGDIYGAGSIIWTPYPVSAEYPNYYYNTLYNTNIYFLENIVLLPEYFNLARYSGLGYNYHVNNDNSYENYRNHPELVFNNAEINIERHFLINVVKNVEDIPQGYVFDHYLNASSGHPINVYKQVKDVNTVYRTGQYSNNQYYNNRIKSQYVFVNVKTVNYIISTEGYDFQECYLQNNYQMGEQLRLTNLPFVDINNIFNTDKVKTMKQSYVGQFRNNYYGDETIQAICPKKVESMLATYADGYDAIKYNSSFLYDSQYGNDTRYYLDILNEFGDFNFVTNTYVPYSNYTVNGPQRCLYDYIFDSNIKFTMAYMQYWYLNQYKQPPKKIKPICGVSVKNMIDTYAYTNIMGYRPACGDNVINFINAYCNCIGNNNIKPYIGPNVVNAMGAYLNTQGIAENKYYIPSKVANAHALYHKSAENLWYNLNNIILSANIRNIDYAFTTRDYENMYHNNIVNNIDENRPYIEIICDDTFDGPRGHLVNLKNTVLSNTLISAATAFAYQRNLIEPASFIQSDLTNFTTNYTGLYFGCANLISFNGPYSYSGNFNMMAICYGANNLRYIENTPINKAVYLPSSFAGCHNLTEVVINNSKGIPYTFYSCKNLRNIFIDNAIGSSVFSGAYNNSYSNNTPIYYTNSFPMQLAFAECPNIYYFIINNIQNSVTDTIFANPSSTYSMLGILGTNWRNNANYILPYSYTYSNIPYNVLSNMYNLVKMEFGQNYLYRFNTHSIAIAINGYNSNLIEIAPLQYGQVPLLGTITECTNLTSLALRGQAISTIKNCPNLLYLYIQHNRNTYNLGDYDYSNIFRGKITLHNAPNIQKIEIIAPKYITTGSLLDSVTNCNKLTYLYTIPNNEKNNVIANKNFFVYSSSLIGSDIHAPINYCWNCDNLIDIMDIPYNFKIQGIICNYQPSDANSGNYAITIFNSLPNFTGQNLQSLLYYIDVGYVNGDNYYGNPRYFPLNHNFITFDGIPNLNLYNLNRIFFNFSYENTQSTVKLFNNTFILTNNCNIINIQPSLNELIICDIDSDVRLNLSNHSFNYDYYFSFFDFNLLPYNNINHLSFISAPVIHSYSQGNAPLINQVFSLENIQASPIFINQPALRFTPFEQYTNVFATKNINEYHMDAAATSSIERSLAITECIDFNNYYDFINDQYNHIPELYKNYDSIQFEYNYRKHIQNILFNKDNIYKNYYANLCKTVKENLVLFLDCVENYYNHTGHIYGMSQVQISNCLDNSYFSYFGPAFLCPIYISKTSNSIVFPYGNNLSTQNYISQAYYVNSLLNYENFYGYNINNINIWFLPNKPSYSGRNCDNYIMINPDYVNSGKNVQDLTRNYNIVHDSSLYINGVKRLSMGGDTNINVYNYSNYDYYDYNTHHRPLSISITPEGSFMAALKDPTLNQQRTAIFGNGTTFSLTREITSQTSKIVNFKINNSRDITTNIFYSNELIGLLEVLPVLNNEFPNNNCVIQETIYKVRAYNSARNLNVYWYDYYLNFYPYEGT